MRRVQAAAAVRPSILGAFQTLTYSPRLVPDAASNEAEAALPGGTYLPDACNTAEGPQRRRHFPQEVGHEH